jgi:hypothetical protein
MTMYGAHQDGDPFIAPVQQGDTLQRAVVDLLYDVNTAYKVDLGYEGVYWHLRDENHTILKPGDPVETYWTIDVVHPFNPNASFRLLYQLLQYQDKGTGFGDGTTTNDMDGDVVEGQFEVTF